MRKAFLFGLLLLLTTPAFAEDWYAVLGVHPEATEDDIRKAYKRLARKYHPDVTAETDVAAAIEKFKEATNAVDVLGDAEKRRAYDRQSGRGGGGGKAGRTAWTAPPSYENSGGIYNAPEYPEGSNNWGRGWFYTTSGGKDVYFDPKTGFPLDFNYNPKTTSEHSELFDQLLNPRNVGKRRTLQEMAEQIKWTAPVKKDFLARARETLRSATTDESFPSNENIRRMKAVFDLPFVRTEFPDLAMEFLKSHSEYGPTFASEYLLEPEWSSDPKFETLWRQSRDSKFSDRGRFPLGVFGAFKSRPGEKTGQVKYSEIFKDWYQVHEVIHDQVVSTKGFKAIAKMIAEEIQHPRQVELAAEQMSWLDRGPGGLKGMKEVLPEIRMIMATKAFQDAEKDPKASQLLKRMMQQLRDKIAEAEALPRLAGDSAPLALPPPIANSFCGFGGIVEPEREKVPRKKAEPKAKPKAKEAPPETPKAKPKPKDKDDGKDGKKKK